MSKSKEDRLLDAVERLTRVVERQQDEIDNMRRELAMRPVRHVPYYPDPWYPWRAYPYPYNRPYITWGTTTTTTATDPQWTYTNNPGNVTISNVTAFPGLGDGTV